MRKRILAIVCAVLLLLAAVCVAVYPLLTNYLNEKYQSEVRTAYCAEIAGTDDAIFTAEREAAKNYNASLQPVRFGAESMQAAQTGYHELLNLAGNGIMGYVEIPKINVYLPIYHGTGAETLEQGVGHLLGSSLPVGGMGTHAILTGHSGVAGQKLFSDLDQLREGDRFYLHVLNEVLIYEVKEIHTVQPEDTTYLSIEENKDRCTLITCTPFGVNTHRLLVQGERVPYEETEQTQETIAETTPSAASTWERQYYHGLYMGAALLMLIAGGAGILYFIQRRRKRHAKK